MTNSPVSPFVRESIAPMANAFSLKNVFVMLDIIGPRKTILRRVPPFAWAIAKTMVLVLLQITVSVTMATQIPVVMEAFVYRVVILNAVMVIVSIQICVYVIQAT